MIIIILINLENTPILISNLEGNIIKSLKDIEDNAKEFDDVVYFSDSYYDTKLNKIFIIFGKKGYSESYDYNEEKIYNIYEDNSKNDMIGFYLGRPSLIINTKRKVIELIESCWDGYIRIWNFHSALLLKKINVSNTERLSGICLWNKRYLFVGCEKENIKLIDLKKCKILNELGNDKVGAFTLRKINIPNYGKCLLTQGFNANIRIWSK